MTKHRDIPNEIKRILASFGWKGNADRDFLHKENAAGEVIARRGDATWVEDVSEAISQELERRDRPAS